MTSYLFGAMPPTVYGALHLSIQVPQDGSVPKYMAVIDEQIAGWGPTLQAAIDDAVRAWRLHHPDYANDAVPA